MQLSDNGIEFIKSWEGLRLLAYLCQQGVPTIGIGSTRYANGIPVSLGDRLECEQDAIDLFKVTVKRYEGLVLKACGDKLTQNQFDACVSLCYNIEAPFTTDSGLLKAIKSGALQNVPQEFAKWNKVQKGGVFTASEGLAKRRFDEAALFMGWKARVIK